MHMNHNAHFDYIDKQIRRKSVKDSLADLFLLVLISGVHLLPRRLNLNPSPGVLLRSAIQHQICLLLERKLDCNLFRSRH